MGKILQITGHLTIPCWKTASITFRLCQCPVLLSSDLGRKYRLDELVWLEQSACFCPTWDSSQWTDAGLATLSCNSMVVYTNLSWVVHNFAIYNTTKRSKNKVSLHYIAVCTQQWWSMPLFLLLLESKPSNFLAALKGLKLHVQNTFLSSQGLCWAAGELPSSGDGSGFGNGQYASLLWFVKHHHSTWNQGW